MSNLFNSKKKPGTTSNILTTAISLAGPADLVHSLLIHLENTRHSISIGVPGAADVTSELLRVLTRCLNRPLHYHILTYLRARPRLLVSCP